MAIITTGKHGRHVHTIDTSEDSGLTSEASGHTHPYTLGNEMTEEGGDDGHTHSIPDFNESINEGIVGGLVFNSRRDEQWYKLSRSATLIQRGFKADDLEEEAPTNVAGGDPNPNIAGFDEPPKKKRCKDFAGHKVFEVDSETFHLSVRGRPKFARLKKFMSLDDFPHVGQDIREFAARHPKKSIILKDSRSGKMLFLKGHSQ